MNTTAEYLLDSDVVIWYLRGRESVVEQILAIARRGRIGLPAIVRAEVLQGMRDGEREATLTFLDGCETLPIDARVADRGGEIVRRHRARGTTIHLADALIAATALTADIPLLTCNGRHYPIAELDVRLVHAAE